MFDLHQARNDAAEALRAVSALLARTGHPLEAGIALSDIHRLDESALSIARSLHEDARLARWGARHTTSPDVLFADLTRAQVLTHAARMIVRFERARRSTSLRRAA